ncbi:MAG: hypothetical protein J0M16_03955 [Gammaproteobacteria bacterium]|nr:hypothetical protein [Gammaproteobacteria bacterium]
MPIDYEHLMSLRTRGERVQYTDRDTLLYSLGVGLGRDPAARLEFPYLQDPAGLRTVPTQASVLVGSQLLEECGWNTARVALREEAVLLERPVDDSGILLVDTDVASVLDRGAEGGALVTQESRVRRERDGVALFTVRRTWLAGADGGFGGPRGRSDGGTTGQPRLPARRPDMLIPCDTRADQALLFGLSASRGRNRQVGGVALLEGLALQGIACVAILREICEFDHTLIRSFACTLTGVASPGETLVAELWQDANVVSCRLRVPGRDAVVLDEGRCILAA